MNQYKPETCALSIIDRVSDIDFVLAILVMTSRWVLNENEIIISSRTIVDCGKTHILYVARPPENNCKSLFNDLITS